MAELVAGAFLQSSFQVIFEKLASVDIRDYFSSKNVDDLVKELNIALNSINHVLEEAEIKQYQIIYVKKWLDKLKHVVYEADQLLDEISTDAMLNKLKAESEPLTTNLLGVVLGLAEGPSASNEGLVSWKPSKRLSSTALVDESSIYGRDVDKEELIKFLLAGNDSGTQVPIISIVGLGGMGKTTLAKLVYNNNKIEEHFELKAWVYVSESYDVVGLTKAILKSFNPSADGEYLDQLQHQLQHMLMGKKYLLVLDDIWNGNVEYWEQLLLPFNHGSFGSKIIVTTREKEVAYHVVKSTMLCDLRQLVKSDCWRLFVTHAFQGKSVCDYPKLESIGRKIMDKCEGLPLAIISLGQLLRKKFSQDEWMKILETDMWRLSDVDNKINPVLRLSYHNLPSDQKRCFAFCSIFPKGYTFEKDELIKLWMAEGLLKCCGSYKSEEEFGNEIFGDLESISFFQQSFDKTYGTYEHYVMYNLVNDLAKSVSGEFCMQIEGARVEGSLERTRHIRFSLRSNCLNKLLETTCELKGLRSLILDVHRGTLISNNVQLDLFSRLNFLRTLSFRWCGLSELVDEISNIKLLRYLDLSFTEITSLPDSICMLYNLQTILLQGCELTELPSNFSKLINLRHLELPYLKKMPKHIGKLNSLQTLPYFVVEEKNGSDLKELEKLNHLHGKICIDGLGYVFDPEDAVTANLKDKKYLEELYMIFYDRKKEVDDSIVESNVSVLEALQPNRSLKRLSISQYRGNRFPNWIRGCHLPNLVSLQMRHCGLCSHLPPLGQLPSLRELSISNCKRIKIIGEELYGNNSKIDAFRSLEVLEFQRMENLEEWLCHEGFLSLKELTIKDCPKLKRALPQHLPSLQKLSIINCNKLEASMPEGDNILELCLKGCDSILIKELPTSLKKLVLCENRHTEFFVEHILGNNAYLAELCLDLSGFVECPSLDLRCYNSLRTLSIIGWRSSSLSFSLYLFTNLHSLYLYNCPELVSFPEGGLPSNLSCFSIFDCPKLIASREEWGLFQLNSLKEFRVSDEFENVESFPEENLLPPNLRILLLYKCSKLRIMNYKGFLHLLSLSHLKIYNCPSLERLPEKGLPKRRNESGGIQFVISQM
ncbi:putative P-loop containing nucleoside triphosphate hydrolase, leucine-rich repeat domain, L [Medicago truncatula]|uniref:Putative P-loop containing nucleoside triphosphate hydrolase, leucine-rich repeat domain, L n=1 Tax=Medicago truncatula TaxID=3880 RepID=A0A396IPX0_MEDTR|nr:putative disease resistance RPP13-like protein 1 [Medicago truncatula]RHN65945.1 putative P-loop containing nucleoside triphosphate hydrolase, leucine-rich repeat domain, L [Medicago truncatula]